MRHTATMNPNNTRESQKISVVKPILRKTESENRSKPFRDLFVSDPVIEDSDENAENLSDIDEEMVDNEKESAVIPKQV